MRSSDRKDIFSEKFVNTPSQQVLAPPPSSNMGRKPLFHHKSTHSSESYSSFEEGFLMKSKDRHPDDTRSRRKEDYPMSLKSESDTVATTTSATNQHSPEDSSFSLGGSAVWVGDESGLDITAPKDKSADTNSVGSMVGSGTFTGSSRPRRSTDASSSSSQNYRHIPPRTPYSDSHFRHGIVKDTHFYHTTAAYKDHHIPIKMPLSTFPEEVGDVSFSNFHNIVNEFMSCIVLSNNPHQGLLTAFSRSWAGPSASTHKRSSNTPHHRVVQCSCYWKTYHFLGPQTTSRRGLRFCVGCLCLGFGMWCRPERLHRKSVSLCQSEEQR